MSIFPQSKQQQCNLNNSYVRMKKTMLTLLTLFKAGIHAGFDVTGLVANPDNPCKEA